MPVYVGLLRAVNLAGGSPVSMERLRTLLSEKGFDDVVTLLQSGNIVFRSPERDTARLEARLEDWVAKEFGIATTCFVRSEKEWRGIVARNPFPKEANEAPNHLVVLALKAEPSPTSWTTLAASIPGRERVQGAGRHAYIVYTDGIGRSRLTNAFLEKHLGSSSTARNWNTVRKLEALASSRGNPGPHLP